jgi:hypothetical protein
MARQDLIRARVAKLGANFDRYVQVYDQRAPFTGERLAAHRDCIALRQRAGTVRAAIDNEEYRASLRRTLYAWGIGRRASHLVSEDAFAAALHAALPSLEALESLQIDATDLPADLAERLWLLIETLGVVENQAKVVAGTKTLHHLLPDLVPPMDREWTGTFFQFHLPEWQDPRSQRRIFQLAYNHFVDVARQVQPEQYVTGIRWRTSRSKVLDNALIGFCQSELGDQPWGAAEATNEVSFEVVGYPPAKNEALSMLGSGHSHAPRVRSLLAAAQQACATHGFAPIDEGTVGLSVVLRCPTGRNPADATNYLGGIADVLENKAHRGSLDHLGDLAAVWLYLNDRQIKDVTYREVEAEEPGYTVTVRQLS